MKIILKNGFKSLQVHNPKAKAHKLKTLLKAKMKWSSHPPSKKEGI